mgnify:CR=1 FL=1
MNDNVQLLTPQGLANTENGVIFNGQLHFSHIKTLYKSDASEHYLHHGFCEQTKSYRKCDQTSVNNEVASCKDLFDLELTLGLPTIFGISVG